MKAVIYTQYGPPEVLRLTELARPVPKDKDVLIKVYATTVTVGDTRMRSFTVPRGEWLPARLYLGIRKPRRPVLGMELAGEVEVTGRDVTRFRPGDAVFASTFEAGFGGYAEYKCLPEDGLLAIKPANLSFGEAAAAVGGGMTAWRCLQRGRIQPGQAVLVYGASGAVGSNAVQMASRHFGADVTGVCSTANLDLVRSLGARQVMDYTQADFAQNGAIYDVVFDAVAKVDPAHAKKGLKPGGVYLNVHRDARAVSGQVRWAELLTLKELIEAGKLRPVIDRVYPLEQIVEAHRYVDQGHKKGNVVITVAPAGLSPAASEREEQSS
jgi:NADPH:quinone reductase-like Zn-dependent oxidoreductase